MAEAFSHFSGALIAGGQSVRMGSDKALCLHEGESFWARQWRLLGEAGAAERFVCGWRRQEFPGAVECIPDALPGCGPLGGLTAALERARHPTVFVLAVDMPRLQLEDLLPLLERASASCGCVGFRESERRRIYEPLMAVYPTTLAGLARRQLESGDCSLQSLVRKAIRTGQMEELSVSAEALERFRSCNFPTDLSSIG